MTATPQRDPPREAFNPIEARVPAEKWLLEEDQHFWKEQRLLPKLREARPEEYEKWLEGHLAKGFDDAERADCSFDECEFYVAEEDFILRPLSRAEAVHILIPEDVEFCGGDIGASDLYCMRTYLHKGDWVPVFPGMGSYEDSR